MKADRVAQRLRDERDRDAFIRGIIREADQATAWVDLDDL
jgi:hypothetical protein